MTDTSPTFTPPSIAPETVDEAVAAVQEQAAALAPENFDVIDWLNDTSYADDSVEIYNRGPVLKQITDLVEQIEAEEGRKQDRDRNLLGAITDEDEELHTAIVEQARAAIVELRKSLAGSGTTFYFRGISPGEREVIGKTLARQFKPRAAVYEDDENGTKVVIQEAQGAGEDHPDYPRIFEATIVAKSFVKAVRNGKVDSKAKTAEDILAFRGQLPGVEYQRLANKAYEVNYLQYDIEKLVTLDFS